jgi:hypothetical protein
VSNWQQAASLVSKKGQGGGVHHGSHSSAKSRMAAKKTPSEAWKQLVMGSGYSAEVGMELHENNEWIMSKGLTATATAGGGGGGGSGDDDSGENASPSSSSAAASTSSGWLWLNGLLTPLSEGLTDQEVMYKCVLSQCST